MRKIEKYKLTIFVSGVIALVSLVIIVSLQLSKAPTISTFRKIEIISQFYNPEYVMPDTTISYRLTPDSLILTFEPKSNYKKWLMDIYIYDEDGSTNFEVNPEREVTVKNNQVVFSDLNLPADKIESFYPVMEAFPKLPESHSTVMNHFYVNLLIRFYPNKERPGYFRNNGRNRYATFDFDYAKSLPEHEAAFCAEFVQRKLYAFMWKIHRNHPAYRKRSEEAMNSLLNKMDTIVVGTSANSVPNE